MASIGEGGPGAINLVICEMRVGLEGVMLSGRSQVHHLTHVSMLRVDLAKEESGPVVTSGGRGRWSGDRREGSQWVWSHTWTGGTNCGVPWTEA